MASPGKIETVAGETNLSRAINAIAKTLNEQKADEFDAERVQELATGATGGEQGLIAYGNGSSGELRDRSIDGQALAQRPILGRLAIWKKKISGG